MTRVRNLRLRLWFAVLIAVSIVSFIVDRTTGAKTGPPYNDPLVNRIAFFIFLTTIPLFLVLGLVAIVRWIRGRHGTPVGNKPHN
jgi:hypothetical protein